MRDGMKISRKPSYTVRIETAIGRLAVWSGLFTEYPQVEDIKAAIQLDIDALWSSGYECHFWEGEGYTRLLEVVESIDTSAPGGSREIRAAGVLIGFFTIYHEAIFSPVEEEPRCFRIRRGGQAVEVPLTEEERRNLKKYFTIQGAQDNA